MGAVEVRRGKGEEGGVEGERRIPLLTQSCKISCLVGEF